MGKKKNPNDWLAIAVFLLTIVGTAAAQTIYVEADANGVNDGSSWVNAYNYLQDALMMASAGDEIRVAQGIYKPDQFVLSKRPNRGREETFQLIDGVTLKGGYAGYGEPDPNARDIDLYETILSGDLNGDDVEVKDPCDLQHEPTRAENSYHVITSLWSDANLVIDGFTISGGNANGVSNFNRCGGGIYNLNGSLKLNCCTFKRNSAIRDGGGMYNIDEDYGENDVKITLINCTFCINLAGDGGGMCTYWVIPTLLNCTFSKNMASEEYGYFDGCGGGIHNIHSYLIMTNCTFNENLWDGVRNESGVLQLTDCTFVNNYGRGLDGACGTLTNCTFIGNHGGGLRIYWGTLRKCKFIQNSAWSGGGLYCCPGGSPTIIDCIFKQNFAHGGGGGIYCPDSSPKIVNCTFAGNVAGGGGGMCNSSWELNNIRRPILTNCIFSGNRANQKGGGISNSMSRPTLVNCAFIGNWASEKGRGMYNFQADSTVINSVFWNGGNEICDEHRSKTTIEYSDIQSGWPGEGNIDADPCFAEPGYWADANDPNIVVEPNAPNAMWIDGDYHLKSRAGRWDAGRQSWVQDNVTSPCIDAGDMSSPIGHEPFPNGGIINMGAYGGTEEASKSYFGEPICETIVAGDINGDCKVDFADLGLMALHWLEERR